MKKTILLLAVVIMFTATSCKKDYTCACTTTYYDTADNSVVGTQVVPDSKIKDTKSKAKSTCEKRSFTTTDVTLEIRTELKCAIK
jgi:hypothetical protein